mmetsp:Transcript_4861/g.8424  ORF Transcript_4861/g.8424 Transcript_4861/m.8424 type:complete len:235 (+) Transcript_4861:195-899(+)
MIFVIRSCVGGVPGFLKFLIPHRSPSGVFAHPHPSYALVQALQIFDQVRERALRHLILIVHVPDQPGLGVLVELPRPVSRVALLPCRDVRCRLLRILHVLLGPPPLLSLQRLPTVLLPLGWDPLGFLRGRRLLLFLRTFSRSRRLLMFLRTFSRGCRLLLFLRLVSGRFNLQTTCLLLPRGDHVLRHLLLLLLRRLRRLRRLDPHDLSGYLHRLYCVFYCRGKRNSRTGTRSYI